MAVVTTIKEMNDLFSNNKKCAIKPQKDMEEIKMHIDNFKKPTPECMTFWKRQN